MEKRLVISAVAGNAGLESKDAKHPAFADRELSFLDTDLELARDNIAETSESLEGEADVTATADNVGVKGDIGEPGGVGIGAEMMG